MSVATLAGTPTADKLDRSIAAAIVEDYQDMRGHAARDARIVGVVNGYGTHHHDQGCKIGCLDACDNSDYIVTLAYNGTETAVYGVYRGRFSLWAD